MDFPTNLTTTMNLVSSILSFATRFLVSVSFYFPVFIVFICVNNFSVTYWHHSNKSLRRYNGRNSVERSIFEFSQRFDMVYWVVRHGFKFVWKKWQRLRKENMWAFKISFLYVILTYSAVKLSPVAGLHFTLGQNE